MKELIVENVKYLATLTKDEADFIEHVLKWDDEQKVAFVLAKKIFEENQDDMN